MTQRVGHTGTRETWRWRSHRGDELTEGFFVKMQHELCIKSCAGFVLVEEDEGGHVWGEGRQME